MHVSNVETKNKLYWTNCTRAGAIFILKYDFNTLPGDIFYDIISTKEDKGT